MIRIMIPQDYDNLYNLWLNTEGMGLNSTDDSREGIERYLKRNPDTCFVDIENGQIVGAILSGNDGRRGFISHTAVNKAYRRKGIATKLVDAVIDAMKKEHINKIALVVFKENKSGNAFWESMGFTSRSDLTYRNKALINLQKIVRG